MHEQEIAETAAAMQRDEELLNERNFPEPQQVTLLFDVWVPYHPSATVRKFDVMAIAEQATWPKEMQLRRTCIRGTRRAAKQSSVDWPVVSILLALLLLFVVGWCMGRFG